MRLGEMLIQRGCIDAVQLQSALAHQRRWGGRIGRSIVHLGFMQESALLRNVGEQMGVPFVEIGELEVPRDVLALLPERLVRRRKVIPLERGNSRRGPLVVAVPDPSDLAALDEIAFATGMAVKPVLAAEADLERAIARLLDGIELRPRVPGFASREDAIELPEDTSPLSSLKTARGLKGGFRGGDPN